MRPIHLGGLDSEKENDVKLELTVFQFKVGKARWMPPVLLASIVS